MRMRKLYVPGLLSLLLLLPLLLYKLSDSRIFEKQYVMEVAWHSPAIENPFMREFPPSRDYIDINLTGNTSTDKVKIEYVKVLLDEMVSSFDSTRGVHITFADTAKYESFIEILDFCSQQDDFGYAPHESNFWIFNRSKNEEQKENLWRGSCIRTSLVEDPEDKNNLAWAFAYGLDAGFWPIGLLFVLLVIMNVKRRLAR